MATGADLSGASLPENAGEDSVSFLNALKGKEITSEREGIIHHSIRGAFAYREGKWKLLLATGSAGWTAPVNGADGGPKGQLYDMEADPGETNNLFDSNPEVVERLLAQLQSDVNAGRSTAGAPQKNDVPNIKLWK